jgi:hypothetical protein
LKEIIMADVIDYLSSLAVGTSVTNLTGVPADGITAGGYSAFVQSVTGKPPAIVQLRDKAGLPVKRAKLVLTKEQAVLMQKWLDKQTGIALSKPKVPPTLEIDLGPVMVPWALKYAVPMIVLFTVAGWVARWYLVR